MSSDTGFLLGTSLVPEADTVGALPISAWPTIYIVREVLCRQCPDTQPPQLLPELSEGAPLGGKECAPVPSRPEVGGEV